jgi:hypothetical protein
MNKTKTSVIALGILVLTSFIPILQVLILTLNGAFLSVFTKNSNTIILAVNGIFTLLSLSLFYFSKSTIAKIFSIIGVVLFFLPLLFYGTERIISTEKYYFLQFLIIGIIIGITLVLIEMFKIKKHTQ